MGTLYGNITQHIPRTGFNIKAVFPSRTALALDEKWYWFHQANLEAVTNSLERTLHEEKSIQINDYILINYTAPDARYDSILDTAVFNDNKNTDAEDNQEIITNPIPYIDTNDESHEWAYPDELKNFGGIPAPGNYHMTIWQRQQVNTANGAKPTYVAIGRLHSILPTFETWGTYHIDMLEPLTSYPAYFGVGKNLTIDADEFNITST